MARMVPFPMLPTDSSAERRLYEGFLEQLDEAWVVYHSVDWVLMGMAGAAEQGEADFVIAHPQHGLLALEVKGGSLEYDPRTRTWLSTGREGRHPISKDPFLQAKGEIHALIEILEGRPGWDRWKPSYGHGVAFPDGTYERPAHPGAPPEIVLDRRHLRRLEPRVLEIMRHWRRPGRRFGAEGMQQLEQALGFRVEIRTPLKLRFDEEDRIIVQLTEEQAWILGYITHRKRAAVTGPAGSGKTILATQVATKLATGGLDTLLTCFNKGLGAELRLRTQGTPHLDVRHFHQLAWDLAEKAGLDLPAAPDPEDQSFWDRKLPGLLAEAAGRLGPRYRAIVVDEGQDFQDPWWTALLSLHEDPDEGILYVFSDDDQNLYSGRIPMERVELCPPLPHNLRNTKRIHEFVSVFHRGAVEPISRGPDGRPVEVLGYRDGEGLVRLLRTVLANLIEEEHVPLEDIAVLTPSGRAKSRLRSRQRIDGFRLSERPEEGAVLATSVHAFKGLERPVVILAEIGDRHEEDVDRYLYVGGSRARYHLIVLAHERVAPRLREIALGR